MTSILIVDDEALIRLVARDILREAGAEVFEAASARAALDILNRREVDVLFTDVMMPGVNGVQLAAQALALRPKLKVVLNSGWSGASATGGFPMLKKPWSARELVQMLLGPLSPETTADPR